MALSTALDEDKMDERRWMDGDLDISAVRATSTLSKVPDSLSLPWLTLHMSERQSLQFMIAAAVRRYPLVR